MNKNRTADLERLVLEKIEALKPLRETVESFDPETMYVATTSHLLDEALEHYGDKAARESLRIVLVDADEVVANELSASCNAAIFPVKALKKSVSRTACVYTSQEDTKIAHMGYCYIACRLHEHGIESFVMDVKPSWLREWFGPDESFIKKNMHDICIVYAALEDEESKDIFLRALKACTLCHSGYTRISPYPQYEHPVVNAFRNDVVLEGGLGSGTTTYQLARRVGQGGRVIGFEPLPPSAANSRDYLSEQPQVLVEEVGMWSDKTTTFITAAGDSSRLTSDAAGIPCRLVDVDSYCDEKSLRCDLLKMDIEGAEPAALQGAMRTIRQYRPKLMISVYHNRRHFLDIPLAILGENLGYRLSAC